MVVVVVIEGRGTYEDLVEKVTTWNGLYLRVELVLGTDLVGGWFLEFCPAVKSESKIIKLFLLSYLSD